MEFRPRQNQSPVQNMAPFPHTKGRESIPLAINNHIQITLFQMMSPSVTPQNEDELLMKWHDSYATHFATFCDNCGLGKVLHGEELLDRLIHGTPTVEDYEFIKHALIMMDEQARLEKDQSDISQLH